MKTIKNNFLVFLGVGFLSLFLSSMIIFEVATSMEIINFHINSIYYVITWLLLTCLFFKGIMKWGFICEKNEKKDV
ncbi:MAG: hypothetical protein PHO23_02715 [Candidatus Pacebacteria bacterium]|nr:hypothetical protein [Candidatus Paceibacterota bacterium]